MHLSGKQLRAKKFKIKGRINQIPGTIKINYESGLLCISIDINDNEFNKEEEYLICVRK